MAGAGFSQDQISCLVCLDLLQDPVTFPCGHSYCENCFTFCWNNQTQGYSCSQCQHTPGPAFGNNVMFADVMEKLDKINLQTALPAHCYAGPGDVECDVCTGRKHKAVKSCLECLKSFCQVHLKQHDNVFRGRRHSLMNYSQGLMHLRERQRKVQQRIQEREKALQEVREAVETHKRFAETAVKESEKIFTDLVRFLETCHFKVTQLIRDQEKVAVNRAERLWEKLQQEIDDLKRRNTELEQLLHTDNHIHFLQSFQSLSAAPESTVSYNITVSSPLSFDDVIKSVSQLKEDMVNFCREEIKDISDKVTSVCPNEPKTRKEFLQYATQFTLDSNTVNHYIHLSDENRTATDTDAYQRYPYHPERFDYCAQVLCRESVCGRCYWEVEWSGSHGVHISVSYKSISRKSNEDKWLFGQNDRSWGVYCCASSGSTPPSNHLANVNAGAYPRLPQAIGRPIEWTVGQQMMTALPVSSSCSRIGVYVDHSAGTLSFYSISDTMTLIHTVQTTFTEPLYPGFYVCKGSTVKICDFTK